MSDAVEAARFALRRACATLPHLVVLASVVRVQAEPRIATAGIFASGRLVVNPTWFLALDAVEQTFVAAHELLHLALDTHARAGSVDPRLFNVAHDYVINDMLREAMNVHVPAGGLVRWGAREESAEAIVQELMRDGAPDASWWAFSPPRATGPLADALRKAGIVAPTPPGPAPTLDVLDAEMERSWYPSENASALTAAVEATRKAAIQASNLAVIHERLGDARAGDAAWTRGSAMFRAAAGRYPVPWERVLSRWLDDVQPSGRSFARASRRAGDRTDVVLPGRGRDGWTLHVVLDTTGSMASELPAALAAIASFGEAAGIARMHVLQCSGEVVADQWLAPEELAEVEILGLGGGPLTPAIEQLESDPDVEAVVVVTDGGECVPDEPPRFPVLWMLTYANRYFKPAYGTMVVVG